MTAAPVQESVAGVAHILCVQRKAARVAFDAFRDFGAIETTRGSLTNNDRTAIEAAASIECRQAAGGGGRRMSGMA